MEITSTVFANNGSIPTPYTCDGSGVNPPLGIENVPQNAKSLTLIMEDPDVSRDGKDDEIWYHWIVFNMSPDTKIIPEGHEPKGIFGTGTSGDKGYYAPCPPDKEHRYIFRVFALDTQIDVKEGATAQRVQEAMKGHILDQAELVGLYERKI